MRVDRGAYANLVLPSLLAEADLDARDRDFATALTYGTVRMRRACDWLVDRHLRAPLEPIVRSALRLGAYQLAFLDTPAHAAVGETVAAAPLRARRLVNAVLRRVATDLPPVWPDVATELSYPDWIVEEITAALGSQRALDALRQMNVPAVVHRRADGYVQDRASQWVAAESSARPGERVADLCAAPGGKATALAAGDGGACPAQVVALDISSRRAGLVAANVARLGQTNVAVVVGDARAAPLRPGGIDRVLVDAPCSGLGVLRRRPDARWRTEPDSVSRLARLQRDMIAEAARLVRPGGTVAFSVCTLSRAETVEIDDWLERSHPELIAEPPPDAPWEALGRGALLLPQAASTDGMYLLKLVRTPR